MTKTAKTTSKITTATRLDTFKEAAKKVAEKLAKKAQADAMNDAEALSKTVADEGILLADVTAETAKVEAPVAEVIIPKVTIIPGPVATVEETATGKKAKADKEKAADKKADLAESVLASFGIAHGARIKTEKELWGALKDGGKIICCRIGMPSKPLSPDYTLVWELRHSFDPDTMKFDEKELTCKWRNDTNKAGKSSARTLSIDNVRVDSINWKLVHVAKDWNQCTMFHSK